MLSGGEIPEVEAILCFTQNREIWKISIRRGIDIELALAKICSQPRLLHIRQGGTSYVQLFYGFQSLRFGMNKCVPLPFLCAISRPRGQSATTSNMLEPYSAPTAESVLIEIKGSILVDSPGDNTGGQAPGFEWDD